MGQIFRKPYLADRLSGVGGLHNKPVLIIVNGLPGAGKTTLARRLGEDAALPVFSRDGIYEILYDALKCGEKGQPPLLGVGAFALLYHVTGTVLAAGQSAIVEGFFGRPDLRTAEFRRLQQAHDFVPLQLLCRAEGHVLLERFQARLESEGRHSGHQDREWLAQNEERLLQGELTPLALEGQIIEVDTTTPQSSDYDGLLKRVREALH